ncbi:MAG: cytochrome c [Ignavibacteriales bacterium]|nr:cytochrome c [Ignavibacteriales bacterium]
MRIRAFTIFFLLFLAVSSYGQEIDLPTDPLNGRIVFEEKKCIGCHAIGGYGGTAGPDLSREQYFGSVLELASIIWNHTPQMNRKFRQLRMDRPKLTENEMLDLLGFLYYLRYLGEPGSVANGKRLLDSKGCITCHSVAGQGGKVGPDFKTIQRYSAPLYMVQAMWNHGPAMQEQIKKGKTKYPILTGQDMVDVAAYLRQVSSADVEVRMSVGNPKKGRVLFEQKSCSNCHVGEGKRKRIESGLIKIDLKKGVTEVASAMWNHGQAMLQYMQQASIHWPRFQGNEMADIIAYIYFLGFEDHEGSDRRGGRVFGEKGCNSCHVKGGEGKGPDLASLKKLDSPVRMIQLMWNHAGDMEDLLITQNKRWPELSPEEMRDLYAYLRKMSKE